MDRLLVRAAVFIGFMANLRLSPFSLRRWDRARINDHRRLTPKPPRVASLALILSLQRIDHRELSVRDGKEMGVGRRAELVDHRAERVVARFAQQIRWLPSLNDPTLSQHENLNENRRSHP